MSARQGDDVRETASVGTGRPRLVDVAALLVVVAAVVNIAIGVLVAVQATATTAPVAPGLVVALVVITVVYAAAVVVLVLLLRAGRTWARAAFAAASSLSLLTLLALNALNLTVTALLLVAAVLLYRRPVNEWVRSLRGAQRT